jgi:hypothetical protein
MKIVAWLGAMALVGVVAVQEPEKTAASAPKPDPLQGVFRLRTRMIAGTPDSAGISGYVAVTQRHMLLVLAGPGTDPDYPLLRAGVRTWKRQQDGIDAVVELGFFTDEDGDIYVEEPGGKETRRVELARGTLRIWQDARSYLEFERLE